MVPPPIARGLVVCESAVVEERTRNVSLINTFLGIRSNVFPTAPLPSAFMPC